MKGLPRKQLQEQVDSGENNTNPDDKSDMLLSNRRRDESENQETNAQDETKA